MSEFKISNELKKTFPWKLAVIFLLFSGVILLMGIYYYRYERNRIFEEQEKSLSAIASLKIKQISQWYADKFADAILIKDNGPLADKIKQFLKDENQTGIRKEITIWLEALNTQYDYNSVAVLDTLSRVRIATSNTDLMADDSIRNEINSVIRYHKIIMTDLHKTGPSHAIRMDLLVPLLDPFTEEQKTIGLVILCIDPDKVLFPLVQSWPTPSRSSETLILRREGDSVLYLNELRHRKNTALNLKFPLSRITLLATKAVNGYEGVTEGTDYRNIPVIGALSKIPGLPWYMVAKTDKNEILEPFQRYSIITVVVIILLVILNFLVFGYWVWAQYLRMFRLQLKDEISLRKSEELLARQYYTLKGIVESSGGPVFSLDRNYCYTSFNKSHARTMKLLYGADIELGKSMLDYQVNNDDKIKAQEYIDRALAGENIEEREFSGDDPEARRFFEVIHNPILNDQNEVIGVAINARDLTERKKIEDKLHESEDLFRNLFENMLNGFAYCKMICEDGKPPDFLYLNVNKAFAELTGLKDVTGKKASEAIPGIQEADPELLEKYNRVSLTGIPEVFEIYADSLKMWFTISVYSPQKGYFVAVFDVITDRKLAEEKLLENEKRLREAQEMSHLGFWLWDIKTGNVEWSDEVFKIFGLDPDTFKPKIDSILELSPWPEENQRDKELINRAIESHNPGTYEQRFMRPDKSIGYYYSTFRGSYDNNGELVSIVGTILDITERKLAEEALRESEDKFKYVFDHSVAGKSITFPSGEIHVNKAFCEMTGYSPEELTNAKWKDISYPDDIKITEDELQSLISGGKDSTRFIKRYIHKNGDIVWADVGTALRRDEYGKPLYFMTTAIDITVRKHTEESLRLKNFVFDDSIAANSISDINGILTEVNAAFLRIWGYQSKDEVIGKSLAGFIKSDADANKILIALEKEGEWEGDYWALRKDGSTFIAHGLATLVKDEKGNGIGYQSAVLDVTDAKRTEERIKNQLAELKRFNGSMVDREIRMIQLKMEINAFCNQLNLPEKYSIPKVKD